MFDAKAVTPAVDVFADFNTSQGFRVGDFIFLSGQVAIDHDLKIVGEGDFEAQVDKVFANIEAMLNVEGSDLGRVVKMTSFLTDMGNLGAYTALKKKHLRPPFPADTTVEVSALAMPGLMIEVEVMALAEGIRR